MMIATMYKSMAVLLMCPSYFPSHSRGLKIHPALKSVIDHLPVVFNQQKHIATLVII